MDRDLLITSIDRELQSSVIKDYCPNGLQFEGRAVVKKVVVSVSASELLFKEAAKRKADLIIVHHGLFWNSQSPVICGNLKKRISALFKNSISLAAYHLPLDVHPRFGNNIAIAQLLKLENIQPFGDYKGRAIGFAGKLPKNFAVKDFARRLKQVFKRDISFYGSTADCDNPISTVAVVSGGAAECVHEAVSKKMNALITGEASEFVVRVSEEEQLLYCAVGHYASERFGVQGLAEWIKENYSLETEFIDLPVNI